MTDLWRLFHTARHLRAVQVLGRVQQRLVRPRPDLRPAPPVAALPARLVDPVRREPTMAGPRRFTFLNVAAEVSSAGDWQRIDESAGVDRLWLYNLHYFDDLTARDAAARERWHVDLIADWLRSNPPAQGAGWEPYPLSRRIANWVRWAWAGGPLSAEATHSLAVQLRYLTRRLEYHLLGNHLLANAKALVLGGLFFEGDEAEGWLRRGLALFDEQLPEQILADGGHYERSPMYHAVVLEDLLDVLAALRARGDAANFDLQPWLARWPELIQRMRRWLAVMSHPDGEIGLFNDAALGIAAPPAELEAYATRLGMPPIAALSEGVTHLETSGYIRVAAGPAVALLDVAPLGPDFLPGHAHADTLSMELSLFGKRFLVHSGTSTYREGARREWERSTAAHNTVELAGQSSSEMWGAFRVARRARVRDVRIDVAETIEISAEHDGYRRLQREAIHRRRWRLDDRQLVVDDQIGGTPLPAVARYHFAPDAHVTGVELPISHAGRLIEREATGHRQATLESTSYAPRFGVTMPNLCQRLDFEQRCQMRFKWS